MPTKLKLEPESAPERKLLKVGAGAGAETNSFGSATLLEFINIGRFDEFNRTVPVA